MNLLDEYNPPRSVDKLKSYGRLFYCYVVMNVGGQ